MMKRFYGFIMFISLLSCSSDDDMISQEALTGIWERATEINAEDYSQLETDKSYEYVVEYKFMSNRKFESYSFVREIDNSNIIGYNFQEKGEYSINDNRLSLISDRWISGSEMGEFADLDELILNQEDAEWSFNILIEKDILTFDFDPCGPAESCVGSLKLYRVM